MNNNTNYSGNGGGFCPMINNNGKNNYLFVGQSSNDSYNHQQQQQQNRSCWAWTGSGKQMNNELNNNNNNNNKSISLQQTSSSSSSTSIGLKTVVKNNNSPSTTIHQHRLKSPVIKIATNDNEREIELKNLFDSNIHGNYYDRNKAYEYLFTMMNDADDDRQRRPPNQSSFKGKSYHLVILSFIFRLNQ